jgi:cation transport protein ChaC
VLALDHDRDGCCEGVVYRVPATASQRTLDYLRERELVSYAYEEAWLRVAVDDGTEVEAVTFVTNRDHPQYSGDLDLPGQAAVIARAVGPKGPNADYLQNTVESLEALGLHDPELARLAELVHAAQEG